MIYLKKVIKKWGNSLVIVLSNEERSINNIDEGDIVDIQMRKVKGDK